MLSKKVIKDIQSLGLKKFRDESGLFLAEGPKIVEELMHLIPLQIEVIYGLEDWCHQHLSKKSQVISGDELQRISQLKTPNQVVAVLRQFSIPETKDEPFTLYLDAIQDPGNFGTIIRIADWFGIKQIVCSSGCAELYNPKVVQSTMASIARVNVIRDHDDSWLLKQNKTIYAASLHGKNLNECKAVDSGILIIGNESKGIRQNFLKLAKEKITIPRKGEAESLNAAVATGILLSKLLA